MQTRSWLQLMLCGAVVSCSARSPQPQTTSTSGSVAIVVRGAELGPGSVLDGLRTRIPTMTIATSSTGECPRIIFRGQRSIRNQGNPSVYVDNTLMSDTCVLTQIPGADVEYVEVFSSGITTRPGLQRNPFGVILVFRLRVPSSPAA